MKKYILYTLALICMLGCAEDGDDFFFESGTTSVSGSTSRFHIYGDHLFVAADNALTVFDISDFDEIKQMADIKVTNMVETIFRLGNVLYLGTTTGVLFYDISDPANPTRLSFYEHLTACDPVVANESYAFATLRDGRSCGNNTSNLLDVIDVRDITNPTLISSYNMTSPRGLALLSTNLFVGEGEYGMRWFDVSDVNNVTEIARFYDIWTNDIIVRDSTLIISTSKSLLQMRLTKDNELIQLSELTYE